jgi:hypothetical protein
VLSPSVRPSVPLSLSSSISLSLSLSFSQTFKYHHHAQLDEMVNSALEKGEYKAATGLEVVVRGDLCTVENIVSYSPAWFCQRIEIGDQLVTVDGVHVNRKHYQKMLIGDGQNFSFLVVGSVYVLVIMTRTAKFFTSICTSIKKVRFRHLGEIKLFVCFENTSTQNCFAIVTNFDN